MKQAILFILLFSQLMMAQNDAFLDEVIFKNDTVIYNGIAFSGNLYEYKEEALTPNKCISKCEYVDGVRHGISTYWFMNGQLKGESNYAKGKATGKHIYYFETGNIHKIKIYDNGTVIKDELYYASGTPKHIKNYNSQGLKHGKTTTWYENNQVNTEEYFTNGIQTNTFIKYDLEGIIRLESSYTDGILTTKKSYYASGNLKNHTVYNINAHTTVSKTFFDTTEPEIFKQRSHKNEQYHGKQITKNELGEFLSERDYVEGKLRSMKKYKNNKLTRHAEFINNFKTEKIQVFNENEQLISESFLTNKIKDSIWLTYLSNGYKSSETAYTNGKKEWEGNYKNDQKDGVWIHYNNESLNQTFDTYKQGEKIQSDSFEKVHLLTNRINQANTFAYKNKFTDEIIILAMDDTFTLNTNTERVKYTLKYLFDTYFEPIRSVSNAPYQLIDKFIYVQNLQLSKKETIHERKKNRLDKNSPIIKEKGYHFYIAFQLYLTNRKNEELYNKTEKINKSDKIVNSLFNAVANTYAKSESAAIESAFKSFKLKRFFRKNFKKAYKENKK
ncbi:hypothetical protein [uncultured Kordia sp.]|uniref:toxin-antitoxin system YwqK family antitoxin n=1 Tax=uncultured Kordia sp. TaxID=507699 RepID=UPI002615BEFE|nr:hypothetical protein [uncultured Kordia sp.]